MGQIKVKTSAVLAARAGDVYATIADYREGHPKILPKENLYDLQVEQGGYGAGTVHRFKARILGVEQPFYQIVSEPEPGRVLVEQDIDSVQNVVTTFTVMPLGEGRKSKVEISTTMNASPGIKGFFERFFVFPVVFPSIYRKELKLLEAIAQKRGIAVAGSHQGQ